MDRLFLYRGKVFKVLDDKYCQSSNGIKHLLSSTNYHPSKIIVNDFLIDQFNFQWNIDENRLRRKMSEKGHDILINFLEKFQPYHSRFDEYWVSIVIPNMGKESINLVKEIKIDYEEYYLNIDYRNYINEIFNNLL